MTCNHPFDYLSFLILKMAFSISSYILAITNLVYCYNVIILLSEKIENNLIVLL